MYMTDAQLRAEVKRCEFCEEKPCKDACPADCSPADFIMAIKQGGTSDFKRAAALIMTRNPLGGVCGGVCPDTHCQAACVHQGFDRPVEIPTVQAAIVARAKELGVMPALDESEANGKRVAIVGAGPAGTAAALTLAQRGYAVELFEADSRAGGACALIPRHRLDPDTLATDLDWAFAHSRVTLTLNTKIDHPEALLSKGFDAVVVACGRHQPFTLGIAGEEHAWTGNDYLRRADELKPAGSLAVIGGGAIACDCAVVSKLAGAPNVEMFALESLAEMPMTPKERQLLLDYDIQVSGRTSVSAVLHKGGAVEGLKTVKVALPAGEQFHPSKVANVDGSEQVRDGFAHVIIAIGNRAALAPVKNPAVFFAGDAATGPSTVVEAAASGKNSADAVDAYLAGRAAEEPPGPTKSKVIIRGYPSTPVSLETDFFGRRLPSPFILSAAPPTDGYEQMKKALDAGWAGGVMKTAFDGIPIHIPGDYMYAFDGLTYGNCDNVSGHSLSRVGAEIKRLVKEYPDRLIAASTGGPVSGNDEEDKKGWQHNMKLLEDAGAMAVEFSLSCPQGGDGTEGDIVSQSASLTAKIVDWLMEAGDPEIPKLFKLTAAVTSVAVIVQAIGEVLAKYPNKKAGVTLANTFPTLGFRERLNGTGIWDEGVLLGMSGEGVAPISNLTLASVGNLGVTVSGNGGPMDYKAAAHFLALGCNTVQFCTVAMKYGVGIIEDLHSGLGHLLAARGMKSVVDLVGCALPTPIVDFMELTPVKRISSSTAELCMSCGNCTRCSYGAISLDQDKIPVIDPELCIGCSICTQKCFAGALSMRVRTDHELAVLKED